MTIAQKIIKYFALAFAIFLIVTIISAILSGGYAILKAFGLIHSNDKQITEELKVISNQVKEIETLKIELAYTNLKIKTGAGKINIEKLNTQRLYLELGAGDVHIKDLIATQETKIDGGVGKTELQNCEIHNLKANLGMGEFVFSGKLEGKSEVDSGVGAINVELMDSKENYKIEVGKGLGNVTLDGQKIETDRVYGTGENYLDIDGGVGEIKIDFKK